MTGFLPATHPSFPDRVAILTRSAFDANLADRGWVELDPTDLHALAACDPDEIAELAGPLSTDLDGDDEGDLDGADDVTFGVPIPTTDPTEEAPHVS